MCGIAGYFALKDSLDRNYPLLQRMSNTLRHRGPDSEGYFHDGQCALAFRRLAIVDPEGGDQPLRNENDSLVLICNGEIFNYPDLREKLEEKGHRFRTNCDVEVILHLYEQCGLDALDQLHGQFAFALYDVNHRSLFMARDPFGVNPLFFTVLENRCIFASEIKAILEDPTVPREVDLTGLDQVLSFPGLVSPRTMFKGIQSLASGHYILVQDGAVRIQEYWDLDYPLANEIGPVGSEKMYCSTLDQLLARSVRRRLQADVPVGFYLSGGLDSSLVGAFINRATPETCRHSFSISFTDSLISERKQQTLAANYLGSQHHDSVFDEAEIASRLAHVVFLCEMPLKETYNTCSLALSACAKANGVKAVLSGEGADELLAGYVGYRFDQYGNRGRRECGLDAALEEEFRRRLWGDSCIFYEMDHRSIDEIKDSLYSLELANVRAIFDCANFPPVNKAKLRGRHPLHQRSYLDFKLRLTDHLVSDHGDRMAMGNSVEVRFPFLDLDLVNFLTTVPPDMILRGYRDKYLLRLVAEPWLPPEIVAREKWGFHAQGSPNLLRQRIPWVEDFLSYELIRRQGYFNPNTVEALKKQYRSSQFRLNLPYEQDLLAIVLTFGVLLDTFHLPFLN